VRGFFAFWYDFIVGDDWLVAVGILVALAGTALLARSELQALAWLLMPLASALVLWLSLARATR